MSVDSAHVGTKRFFPHAAVRMVVLAAALLCVLVGCAQSATPEREVGASSASTVSALLLEETPEEKFDHSTVVVLATVDGPKGEFVVEEPAPESDPGPTMRWVYSEWSVIPKKVYKSDGVVRQGTPISVALRGGGMDGVEVYWGEEAKFTPGEEVLLFLGTDTGPGTAAPGRYFTHQLALGKYRIDRRSGIAVNKFEDMNIKFEDLEKKLE